MPVALKRLIFEIFGFDHCEETAIHLNWTRSFPLPGLGNLRTSIVISILLVHWYTQRTDFADHIITECSFGIGIRLFAMFQFVPCRVWHRRKTTLLWPWRWWPPWYAVDLVSSKGLDLRMIRSRHDCPVEYCKMELTHPRLLYIQINVHVVCVEPSRKKWLGYIGQHIIWSACLGTMYPFIGISCLLAVFMLNRQETVNRDSIMPQCDIDEHHKHIFVW